VDAPGDPTAGGNVPAQTAGNLQTQYSLGTLDDTNHLPGPACAATNTCEPVAVALGYTNIVVPPGQQELITFTVSNTPPPSGFYVAQTNGQTGQSLFFSGDPVSLTPEPASLGLFGSGLGAVLLAFRRRRK
jgi:hypothetical protein